MQGKENEEGGGTGQGGIQDLNDSSRRRDFKRH